ncbi:MAG TPA: SPASM domain-containing protein, partial [Candidatus Limnocylindrales bacterium]
GLNFSVHAAMPPFRQTGADAWSLGPEEHGELLVALLDRYLASPVKVRIGTLDSMARSVSAGRGGICTFGECLGKYLAVGPDGAIYPCQRFAGMPDFVVGDVARRPSLAEMQASPAWRAFAAREEHVQESCGGCEHFGFCKGGCPYSALVEAGGALAPTARDPHCAAYRRSFDAIAERALAEIFDPENLNEVVERPDPELGLLRRGPLLSLMREGPGRSQPTPTVSD